MFLPLTLAVYYAVPFAFKNTVLFLTGLLFYAWGEPVYVLIMLLSTAIDYCAGRLMDRFDSNKNIRKATLLVSVVMNLSLLGIFKYGSFFIGSVNGIFGSAIPDPRPAAPDRHQLLHLPVDVIHHLTSIAGISRCRRISSTLPPLSPCSRR